MKSSKMGNCSIKGVTGECHYSIRVLSDWGAVLQFKGPKTAGEVLRQYPGYGIFLQGHASSPLPEQESLSYGLLYYLLPLKLKKADENTNTDNGISGQIEGESFVEKSETKGESTSGKHEGVEKSQACEYVEGLSKGSALEVLPSAGNGVWRVKLVIDTRQLEEILSEQVNTEALIEKMRMAAIATSSSIPPASARRRTITPWKVGWKPTLFSTAIKEKLSNQDCVNRSTS